MIRDYKTGEKDSVTYFTGVEVEKTPAYGMKTLFVVGLQDPEDVMYYAAEENCKHIFFGANHSYDPKDANEYIAWDNMIQVLLKEGYLCSLDIPISIAEHNFSSTSLSIISLVISTLGNPDVKKGIIPMPFLFLSSIIDDEMDFISLLEVQYQWVGIFFQILFQVAPQNEQEFHLPVAVKLLHLQTI